MKLLNILLANLKQGVKNKHLNIFSLNSKFCISILQLLLRLNYIQNFVIINKKFIKIYLKYFNNQCVFSNIVKISKGGCRVYWSINFLKKNKFILKINNGSFILSTSRGLLTWQELYFYKMGGECLFYIY